MQNILLTLMLSFVFGANISIAQIAPVDETTGKITYTDVVEIEGATASQLFERAKKWFPLEQGSPREIKFADNSKNEIWGECSFPVVMNGASIEVDYTLKIKLKDGRYKYIATSFTADHGSDYQTTFEDRMMPNKREIYDVTNDRMKALFKDLKAAMSTSFETKNEDW